VVTAKHLTEQGHDECAGQRQCRAAEQVKAFNRIAVFPVYLNTDVDSETVAEIVDVSNDGNTLVYTDGKTENLGFVDIKNPSSPRAAGIVGMDGEPTSVAVAGEYALVAVNTSTSFVATSGKLVVVDIERQRIVSERELGGQPDSIEVSPDGRYAAIAIENERDEDLGNGAPPQAPPGYLVIVDIEGEPNTWNLRRIELTGIANLYPQDPEPEYVDINDANVAVVTLQENNHIILVHCWLPVRQTPRRSTPSTTISTIKAVST
jgi:hypothetical protein